MKTFLLFTALLFYAGSSFCQTLTYDDFEGAKSLYYSSFSGKLDTMAKNPSAGKFNSSATCAKYTRSSEKKFDNIKMSLHGKLSDVSSFATYAGNPPQIKVKIYTNAPVGTLVEILLGSKGRNNEYPEGTHSQYQAYTTTKGAWEELSFKFSQIPQGSQISAVEIDQITLLFNPNSSASDIYYFDEITGPAMISQETAVSPGNAVKK